ncbi:hypothetical protein [Deinococcus kurensis]|uniref:hypothetical protein n=1 Tax=Deinococcus kurensis TaxID=2662757 RepID=UPI0012D30AF2|nr:hypothetical protein [Deinococcus kurensis]
MSLAITFYDPVAAKEGPVHNPALRRYSNWPGTREGNAQVFIDYLRDTPERSWLTGHVRTKAGDRHCALSHAFALAGNTGWEVMENILAGSGRIFAINDGRDPDYPQPTARLRILAALEDYKAGRTMDLIEELEAFYRTLDT